MRGINGESATGSMSGNYSLCDQMLVGNEGSDVADLGRPMAFGESA